MQKRIQTWEKQINENGEEIMVLIEDYYIDEPEPTTEELQVRAEGLMTELQSILDKIKGN